TRAAIDQQHAHLLFELLDTGRQRRLRHCARLCGAAEMPCARQREQEFELVDHVRPANRPTAVGQKYIRNRGSGDRSLLSPYSIFAIVCSFKPLQIGLGGQNEYSSQAANERRAGNGWSSATAPDPQGPANRS